MHTNGPGLKIVNPRERWYGAGYCAICGSRDAAELIPVAVRYWDCDDGWRFGVLCGGCGDDASARGPRPDDYAVATREPDQLATDERIDLAADLLGDDLDGVASMVDE